MCSRCMLRPPGDSITQERQAKMRSVQRLGQGHMVQDFDCQVAERQGRIDVPEGFGALGMPVIEPAGQVLLVRGKCISRPELSVTFIEINNLILTLWMRMSQFRGCSKTEEQSLPLASLRHGLAVLTQIPSRLALHGVSRPD